MSVITRTLDFEAQFESPGWIDVAADLCRRHGLNHERLERSDSSDHVVCLVDKNLVVKIYRPWRNCFHRELRALDFVRGNTIFTMPAIVHAGEIDGLDYIVMTQVPGERITRAEFQALPLGEQHGVVRQLADGLRQMHHLPPDHFKCDWPEFIHDRAGTFIDRQIAHGVNPEIISSLPEFLDANLKNVPTQPTVFLHGDVHFGNLRFERSAGGLKISGLFDFADSRRGFYEYDFLAVGVLMLQGEGNLQREFFRAYGYTDNQLNEQMRRRLMMLTMLYETSDLRRYALRLRSDAVELGLDELEQSIWSFC